jgi:hypothetical protein
MAQLETSIPGLAARRSIVRHIIGQAGVALVYLGIVATFAFVTFIACLFLAADLVTVSGAREASGTTFSDFHLFRFAKTRSACPLLPQ